jgi:hypothetical protein
LHVRYSLERSINRRGTAYPAPPNSLTMQASSETPSRDG